MMILRFLMIATGLFLLAIAGGLIAATPYWEPMARDAMAKRLGTELRADAALGSLSLDLQRSAIVLNDVLVRNPATFETGEAIHAAKVLLIVNPSTIFAEAPTITAIVVEELQVGLRWTPGQGTNLGALAKQASTPAAPESAAPVGRSVHVQRIECSGGSVVPRDPAMGSPEVSLPLEPFVIEGLDAQGAIRPHQVVGAFLQRLLKETATLNGLMPPVKALLDREAAAPV